MEFGYLSHKGQGERECLHVFNWQGKLTPRDYAALTPADLGTRESVWPIRSRHEYAIGIAVIEMAPGDTTVGSTPDFRTKPESEIKQAA